MTPAQAHRAALDAEAAWEAEIARAFPGSDAQSIRYSPAAGGKPGTPLRAAYDAFVEASAKLREAFENPRKNAEEGNQK